MRLVVLLASAAVAFAAVPAHALSARLLPKASVVAQATLPADAPTATPAPAPAPVTPTATTSSATFSGDRMPYLLHLGIGAATGIVTVPVGLLLASVLGNLSISQLGALIPSFLTMGLFAPALTTLVAWLVGNWRDPGRFGFWLPAAGSVLVNIISLIVGGFAGLSVGVPVRMVVFSLIAGVLLGGTSVGTMHLFEKKPVLAAIPSVVPGVSETTVLPFARVAF